MEGTGGFVLQQPEPSSRPPEGATEATLRKLWWEGKWWTALKNQEAQDRKEQKKKGLSNNNTMKNATRNTRFFVDQNGNAVSIDTANAARSTLRGILGDLDRHEHLTSKSLKGKPCMTWSDMTELAEGYVIARLEHQYPLLKLCEGHWKAKQLASDNFSHYILSRENKRANAEIIDLTRPSKRVKKEESVV